MLCRLSCCWILAAILSCALAQADEPIFLRADALEDTHPVGAPPDDDSEEFRADLAIVLWMQQTRTEADIAMAVAAVRLDVFSFSDVIGPRFNARTCPQTDEMFRLITAQAKAVHDPLKDQHGRARPFQEFPELVFPVIDPPESKSYPSGHATRGMTMALLLADLLPEMRSSLIGKGRWFGNSRVVAGVHYPTDIIAGRKLGEILAKDIIHSEAWRDVRPKLAEEIRQAIRETSSAADQELLPALPATAR